MKDKIQKGVAILSILCDFGFIGLSGEDCHFKTGRVVAYNNQCVLPLNRFAIFGKFGGKNV
jgi:hypothetical protein